MARIAPERTNFFVRSNYQVGVESKPERSVAEKQSSAARALFDLAEQAIRGIEEGVQAEAALRQLWASLVEFRGGGPFVGSYARPASPPLRFREGHQGDGSRGATRD